MWDYIKQVDGEGEKQESYRVKVGKQKNLELWSKLNFCKKKSGTQGVNIILPLF